VIAPKGLGAAQIGYCEDVFNRITNLDAFKASPANNKLAGDFMNFAKITEFIRTQYAKLNDVLNKLKMADKR